jgi:large subunit ribosomal protein L31
VKDTIHPKWYPNAKVACACGNTFETGSTISSVSIDSCAACHPFFTGQASKFVDAAGRVDKFNQRVAAAEKKQAEAEQRKHAREAALAAAEGA